MEIYSIEELTFIYPEAPAPVLYEINLKINQGEFITICGASGSGKSTLLRQLKTVLTPWGKKKGRVMFQGKPLEDTDQRSQTEKIGFIMQNPDNQIVTDKVWHELAFGLESLGCSAPDIRLRVAEMASFFGIQTWFHKKVTELSGGQKQLLNLAAVMIMNPSVLILDEPSGQLDPIAASDFLTTVHRINRDMGTTVIITEQRLEEVFSMSDRVIVMDGGCVVADGTPKAVGLELKKADHRLFRAMPSPMRIYAGVENDLECPVTVREGRNWLDSVAGKISLKSPAKDTLKISGALGERVRNSKEADVIKFEEVWFRYGKDEEDVLRDLSFSVKKGEFYAILGGNGTGKTTMLSLIAGINRPYRGKVSVGGEEVCKIPSDGLFKQKLGVLPQNPQALFVKDTVEKDLYEMLSESKAGKEENQQNISRVIKLCDLEMLLNKHPYDLSGGEQQRVAIAKVLLLEPKILLLDEPTKGLDIEFKEKLASILRGLLKEGVTIVMVSHDIEFCARHADRCAIAFDGGIVSEGEAAHFFKGNCFYTTSANRMARHLLPDVVTAEDVIAACGGAIPATSGSNNEKNQDLKSLLVDREKFHEGSVKTKLSKRTLVAAMMILFAIPLTIFLGIYYLDDRKYFFISLLVITEAMLPFIMVFESRKPQARELVMISVLCGIAVAGRAAFFMVPQVKPVLAIVIIAGACLGGETGFLVGAVSGFVSNFFFGQGPWTPWQMFAFGITGFLAGILFKKGWLSKSKTSLCVFGGLSALIIYGGLMNSASVLMYQSKPTKEMFIAAYIQGVPFDLIHSMATVMILFIISGPMIEKLDRIKEKYGML